MVNVCWVRNTKLDDNDDAAQETTISGREEEAQNCRGSSPLGCAWRAIVRERELQIMTSSERYTSRFYRS